MVALPVLHIRLTYLHGSLVQCRSQSDAIVVATIPCQAASRCQTGRGTLLRMVTQRKPGPELHRNRRQKPNYAVFVSVGARSFLQLLVHFCSHFNESSCCWTAAEPSILSAAGANNSRILPCAQRDYDRRRPKSKSRKPIDGSTKL